MCGISLGEDVSGLYQYQEMLNNKQAYKHQAKDFYLFYSGWWKVDTGILYNSEDKERKKARGYILTDEDAACPEQVSPGSWIYYRDYLDHEDIAVSQGRNIWGQYADNISYLSTSTVYG